MKVLFPDSGVIVEPINDRKDPADNFEGEVIYITDPEVAREHDCHIGTVDTWFTETGQIMSNSEYLELYRGIH